MALKSIDNASENDGRGEKDGLADDDANLMIKMKFLTYKVILGWKVFWLEGFVICCNFLALSLHYHPDVGHVFIFLQLRTFLIRNGLSILFKDGAAAYKTYYLR